MKIFNILAAKQKNNNTMDNQSFRDSAQLEIIERLTIENKELARREKEAYDYIRKKTDQLLVLMGTVPLKAEELDNKTLIDTDPIGIVCDSFSQVIENLRATNLKLKEARDEITAIFDSVGSGIMVLDEEMKVITYNNKMMELFDDTINPVGKPCSEVLCNDKDPENGCAIKEVFKTEATVHQSNWICKGHNYDIVGTPIMDEKGAISKIVILYMDITRRKEMEESVRESEERYRSLFENSTDLIQIVAPDGKLLYVNPAWLKTFGYSKEELDKLKVFDLIDPGDKDHCMKIFNSVLSNEKVETINTTFISKDGRKILVEGNASCKMGDGKPVSAQCIFRDVTEKRQLENELLQAQKLESVGLLAGGIAHDFNNLLTAILGNISLAKLSTSPEEAVYSSLVETEKASLRARNLTKQLLTFSKGGMPVKETTSIPELINEVTDFCLHGSNIKSVYLFDENLLPIEVDKGQFSQVIQNIIINADHAMPAGGTITIEGHDITIVDQESLPLPPGRYVEIIITDKGEGIPENHLQKLFDPYFTTKQKGSGLGLTTAYSIIKKHGGLITVNSTLGNGTSFHIYLPASEKPIPTPSLVKEGQEMLTGKGRILLMDDEEVVRDVGSEMLNHLGFSVDEAEDGQDAIDKYKKELENNTPYDLVIMDLTIPGGMGGKEAVEKLLEIDPAAKVVVSSGYANDPIMAEFNKYGFSGVVPKPYHVEELSKTIHSVINE